MKQSHYEATFLIQPNLSEKEVQNVVKKYQTLLKDAGAVQIEKEHWGMRNIAYPIRKHTTAFFHIFRFQAPGDAVDKLEQSYSIDEDIIRFLTVSLGKYGVEYFKKKKEAKKQALDNPETDTEGEGGQEEEKKRPLSRSNPRRKKYCRFRKFGIKYIDYKEQNFLISFLNPQGKILPRRLTGNSAKYQRLVNQAVKRARQLGQIPYVVDNLK